MLSPTCCTLFFRRYFLQILFTRFRFHKTNIAWAINRNIALMITNEADHFGNTNFLMLFINFILETIVLNVYFFSNFTSGVVE